MKLNTVVILVPLAATACGWQNGETDALGPLGAQAAPVLTKRHGTVLVDGCALSAGQASTLAASSTKELVEDVIFLCFTLDTTGAAQPTSASARTAFGQVVTQVRAMGYSVKVGMSLSGDAGGIYDAATTTELFESTAWQSSVLASAVELSPLGDGLDLDFQQVPDSERYALTELVTSIAGRVRPKKLIEVFVPPSVAVPSDLPDGDAFDVKALGNVVDRVRVMTLDYSTGTSGGPTMDSGWAVDAAALAAQETSRPIDVAVPLYGWDFNADGSDVPITFSQAESLASSSGASIARSLAGDLSFSYVDGQGMLHNVWFDDARATLLTLAAWSPSALPPGVGVLFYGLGSEDPSLWSTVAEATTP
jgi:spore germination protein YaaH